MEKREFETLIAEISDGLGHITLNRPERLNAINDAMINELTAAVGWLDAHRELRVVILRGSGRAFTAGADLRGPGPDALRASDEDWLTRRRAGQLGIRLCDALEQMQAVTIAQVHGAAVGGGVALMAACDLRIVAQGTVMYIPEVDLGVPLSWGTVPRLVREMGPAIAKELVITCRRFTPEEALAWRWINRVVPLEELAAEVERLAEALVAKPLVPMMITKDHVNSIARVMAAGTTSFTDGDLARWCAGEEAAKAALHEYARARLKKTRDRA